MDIVLDIETRGRVDLTEVGAARYGCDPETEIMMAAVADMDDLNGPVHLWINPAFRDAGVESDPDAQMLLISAERVHAHNAPFEQAVLDGKSFEPAVPISAWRCTAAMARIAGLPESLEKVCDALKLDVKKDSRGKGLIRFFSIPKPDGTFNEPRDHREKWAEFCAYCVQDVRAERAVYHKLKTHFDLSGLNLDTFQFTMRMNAEGIPVNVAALRNAQSILDEVSAGARERFAALTGVNITQRAKVLAWLQGRGVEVADMQADTLTGLDRAKLQPEVAEAVSLYAQLSFAATKKIGTMLDWVCPDGRMRGVLKFYGAGTGRWSAGGPQIQNAKKATPEMRPITHAAYRQVCGSADAEALGIVYGDPVEVLASCIRHFIHQPGSEMLDADYNAIEARVICWLAKEADALKAWASGTDQYKKMASVIYGVPIAGVNADQRDMGKRTILGCGYGMGAEKFLSTCLLYGVKCDKDLADRAVSAYRKLHPNIVAFWRRLNNDAMSAVANPGTRFNEFIAGKAAGRAYLFMRLPSGRRLAYPDPMLENDPQFGQQLTYWGQTPGKQVWGRIKLYGGKLAENASQAVAADVMSHGAREAERCGMRPFALIHDQGLAIRNGHQPEEFAAALAAPPPWAPDLPLRVEAKITPYYSK